MDKKNPVQTGEQETLKKGQLKRPYKKPAFQYEKVFETQALICGKISTSTACHINRKSS